MRATSKASMPALMINLSAGCLARKTFTALKTNTGEKAELYTAAYKHI